MALAPFKTSTLSSPVTSGKTPLFTLAPFLKVLSLPKVKPRPPKLSCEPPLAEVK